MLPGNSRILTCPYCGKEKEVLSLISGNTFLAKNWSDGKTEAPMLPKVSSIQKCPHCGKYYLTYKQEVKMSKDSYSSELGTPDF